MRLKIFLPSLLIFFISCSQQRTRENDVYIVPQRQRPPVDRMPDDPPPPPPIQPYYLNCNFIIDSSGEVFFYGQPYHSFDCATGWDWDTPPKFIDLKPEEIVHVPVKGLTDFIQLNVLSLDFRQRLVAIASAKDTIQSAGLSKIFAACNNNANEITWAFRKTTQEENIVLKFKKLNLKYYPEDIKWDSTNILFPLNEEVTPFEKVSPLPAKNKILNSSFVKSS